MEFIIDALNWLWMAITDDVIAAAVKPRLMFFGFIATVVTFIVKRTKSTADDELLAALRQKFFPE